MPESAEPHVELTWHDLSAEDVEDIANLEHRARAQAATEFSSAVFTQNPEIREARVAKAQSLLNRHDARATEWLADQAEALSPAAETVPDARQAAWEAELAAANLTYINEYLRYASYVREEFPPSVELDDTTELVVWKNDKRRTMDQIRAAIIKDGITPASPQHGPEYAPKQENQTAIWIPQYSESASADGDRDVVYLERDGENRRFDRYWSHPDDQWRDGGQFLGVRTKPSEA